MYWKKFFLFSLMGLVILSGYIYISSLDWLRANFSQQHRVNGNNLSGVYDPKDERGVWQGQVAYSSENQDTEKLADKQVLGTNAENKRIEIDLTNQKLYAFEGNNKVYEFPISSGLYDWTPRGTFNIWIKLKYTKTEGGNRALSTYYTLPNVPYTMYFANGENPPWRGFGIHGAYWHNDFGRPKSHGCINMRPADAQVLYYWTQPDLQGKNSIRASNDNPGTKIIIYGKYAG